MRRRHVRDQIVPAEDVFPESRGIERAGEQRTYADDSNFE